MSHTKHELSQMGIEASAAFLAKQVPLNDSISKLANENDLNTEQVKRVCEFANCHTFEKLRRDRVGEAKQASDVSKEMNLYITFPIADPKVVLSKVSSHIHQKEAAASTPTPSEFFSGVPANLRPNVLPPGTFSKQAAAEEPPHRMSKEEFSKKIAALESEGIPAVQEKLAEAEINYSAATDRLNHILRTLVLDHEVKLAEVIQSIGVKQAYAAVPRKKALIKEILKEALSRLQTDGVIQLGKFGSAVDPDEFIAKEWDMGGAPEARIINGSHPLFAAIDDCSIESENKGTWGGALHVLDDKVRYAKRKLRDFQEDYA